ncbi:acyl-CoA-binding domain-containing protein 4 [Podila epicladia]|nr:acyl-CoA-binding domain-containing protein 4 [Podila epicladia]
MIISGGSPAEVAGSLGDLHQTFSLDLTVPWDASSPKYNFFGDGPGDLYVPSGLSGGDSMVVVSRGQSFSFNLSNPKSWTLARTLSNGIDTKATRLTGAIDPATNTFYLPGGYRVIGANNTMMVYNIAHGTTASLPMPSTLAVYSESTAAWSAYAKRLFMHGGLSMVSVASILGDLFAFNPADNTWSQPVTGGTIPPGRHNHCMISDATGKRLVVFGGFNAVATPALSDIYVLDVATMQWQKGPDAGSAVARAAPSCGIDHDFFIVWGGGYSSKALTKNVTLLFNLQTMQWVDKFVPAAPMVTPSDIPDTPTKPSSSSTGAIIGGVVGGLAAVAIVIGCFLYQRKQARSAHLDKPEVAKVSHRYSDGYVPPPSGNREQNQHYHEQQSHQQQPSSTKTNESQQSPQYWGGKNTRDPNTNSEYQIHSMEPIQRCAPQSYAPTVVTRTQQESQANGPHAVIS